MPTDLPYLRIRGHGLCLDCETCLSRKLCKSTYLTCTRAAYDLKAPCGESFYNVNNHPLIDLFGKFRIWLIESSYSKEYTCTYFHKVDSVFVLG